MTGKPPTYKLDSAAHKFLICTLGPSGSYDFPVGTLALRTAQVSPEMAARRDMAAFLEFADEVARVARGTRQPKQLKLLEPVS